MAPIYQRLAEQYAGQMLFAKVDTDKEQALAQRLGIRSLPTLLFVYRGQVVDGVVGALPAPQLQARIQQVLALAQQMGGPAAAPPAAGAPGPGAAGRPGAGARPPATGAPRGPQEPNGGQRPKIILP
jgi:hypothetical protein